jgi:hypothetical protein
LLYFGGELKSHFNSKGNLKIENAYFTAFGYELTRSREFHKAIQKPSRQPARLGAFYEKAIRGA